MNRWSMKSLFHSFEGAIVYQVFNQFDPMQNIVNIIEGVSNGER